MSRTMIDAIEQAVIQRLREQLPDVEVESFPEEPDKYRLTHANGALLVSYRGSRYGDAPRTLDSTVGAGRQVRIAVTVIARSLKPRPTQYGIYQLLEGARLALSGQRPAGCGPLYPVEDGFVNYLRGEWQFEVIFEGAAVAVERPDEKDQPLLREVELIQEQMKR